MPELPEVESIRRHLAPTLEGAKVEAAEVRRPRMVRRHERPGDFADRMRGRRVISLGRRGKFLLAGLEGDVTWVTHLGMSGRVSVASGGDPEEPHTNVVVRLAAAPEVRLVDPRTFGFVAAFLPAELGAAMSGIGPDALEELPSAPALGRALESRRAPIKALLLDQSIVSGLGNIYADEVLYAAGLSPLRAGGTLTAADVAALRAAIRPVLESGISRGGTSLGDLAYLLPDGRAGENLEALEVYGRLGLPCRRCGGEIGRSVVRARSSYWCRRCQT